MEEALMMEIFILRHGDASSNAKKLTDDSKRSLSENGVKEIENASNFFEELEINFDHIFSSPLKRAKQTSEIILKKQSKSNFTELEELKPEGRVEEICKKLSSQKENIKVLIVGHNPLLVDLTNYIINSADQISTNISLKTGGIIKIKVSSVEPKMKGELQLMLPPKLIRKFCK
ncbi:MAG TPA: phosphohistidine phosphatase SixA [Candidatus Nitrosotenuis sp.]